MSENEDNNDNEPAVQAAEPTTPPPSPEPPAGDTPSSEERTWALFAHISAIAGVVIPIPGSNCLGPLIVWLVKKDEMPFVDDQGKEALNFQITVALAMVVCFILMLVFIGFLAALVVGIGALVLTIIATIKANSGEHYRYPISWRIIK